MNKKKVIIIVAVAVVVICAAVVAGYQLTVGSAVREQTAAIETCCEGFEQAERSAQVEMYHKLEAQYDTYQNSERPIQKVTDIYEVKLKELKQYLVAFYDKTISDNTIENINKNKDKNAINNAVNGLNALLETVRAEKISEEEYEDKISKLISSYNDSLENIEKEALEKILSEYDKFIKSNFEKVDPLGPVESRTLITRTYDIDKDGVPELITRQDYYKDYGTDDIEYIPEYYYTVYTYKDGKIITLGTLSKATSLVCGNSQDKSLIAHEESWKGDSWAIDTSLCFVSIKNNKLVVNERQAYDLEQNDIHCSNCVSLQEFAYKYYSDNNSSQIEISTYSGDF